MESFISHIRDKKILHKFKLKNRHARQLSTHVMAVAVGVRSAYLLEGLAIDLTTAKIFINHVLSYFNIELSTIICTLVGDFDVIFVHRESLCQIVSQISSTLSQDASHGTSIDIPHNYSCKHRRDETDAILNCSDHVTTQLPLIVDINGPIPSIIGDADKLKLFQGIYSIFHNLLSTESSYLDNTAMTACDMLNYPLLAGLLLGYPCVYSFMGITPNSLNGQELMKYSYKLSHPRPGDDEFVVMEFTVPRCVYESSDSIKEAMDDWIVTKESNDQEILVKHLSSDDTRAVEVLIDDSGLTDPATTPWFSFHVSTTRADSVVL